MTARDRAEGRCCGPTSVLGHEPANGYTHYPTDRTHYPLTYWEAQAIREIAPHHDGHIWWDCNTSPCLGCHGSNPARHNCIDGDPLPEGTVRGPLGRQRIIAYVWLADRVCRVRCSCACKTNPWTEPETYAGTEQPSLFAGV